jgi:hypothetical protein
MVPVADRRKLGTKDMVMTMAVVLVVVALIALYGNNVSFAPGGPAAEGPVPTADVIGGFAHAKATMDFPITVPEGVPEKWHPNSVSVSDPDVSNDGVARVGTLKAVRGGWITPRDNYIQLVEAEGDVPEVLANEFGAARQVSGTVDAGGAEWSVTTGVRSEAAWIRTVQAASGETTLLITGNATEDDFRALAAAVASAR